MRKAGHLWRTLAIVFLNAAATLATAQALSQQIRARRHHGFARRQSRSHRTGDGARS
jgi:hypothetical protein